MEQIKTFIFFQTVEKVVFDWLHRIMNVLFGSLILLKASKSQRYWCWFRKNDKKLEQQAVSYEMPGLLVKSRG